LDCKCPWADYFQEEIKHLRGSKRADNGPKVSHPHMVPSSPIRRRPIPKKTNKGIAKRKVVGLEEDDLDDVASSSSTNLNPISTIATETEEEPFDDDSGIAIRLGSTNILTENGRIDLTKAKIIASSNFSIIYSLKIAYRPELVLRPLRKWLVRDLLLNKHYQDNRELTLNIGKRCRNRSTT
jgi:hypothetical protein